MFKKILIFGSSGMVGRNLIDLCPKSVELICPSRSELDLIDAHSVQVFIKNIQPDLIINCAGKVGGIKANMAEPFSFFVDNMLINQSIILGAYNSNVKYLLNFGSSCMFPRNAENPLKEDMLLTGELEPTNEGYALAKIAAQRMISYLSFEHPELCYKTVIPCNLYGKYDKFEEDKAHMIPAVIARMHQAVVENKSIVTIWGDGSARREFMYAEDLAYMIWTLLDNFEDMPQLMNLGLGVDYTIFDYYKAIAEVVGFKGEFEFDLSKPIGMKQKVVDITLQNNLNLSPQHTLNQGINKTFNYYLKNYTK
jgi:GDP-L-fucose synthase